MVMHSVDGARKDWLYFEHIVQTLEFGCICLSMRWCCRLALKELLQLIEN